MHEPPPSTTLYIPPSPPPSTTTAVTMPSSPSAPTINSTATVIPAVKSTLHRLKLSVSDLPMLSCHYIQKGNLFLRPPIATADLLRLLKGGLSAALTHFPPLAGRLTTDTDGQLFITSNDAGVHFLHATATHLSTRQLTSPDSLNGFFAFDRTVSFDGHFKPLLAVQVTELNDGVFIGFSVNHAVVDGTSLWNFVNTFSEISRGAKLVSNKPCFARDSVLISPATLKLPVGGPTVTFDPHAPLRERIFSISKESISKLKQNVNNPKTTGNAVDSKVEISSFQSLCALLWRAVTRARKFNPIKTTTFRMAVNCRHRLKPELGAFYFGNAIQSIPTYATAGDVLTHDLRWCAEQLNRNVVAHDDAMVRGFVKKWESEPRCFPLGNAGGGVVTMGSSPRFPMFENDFGWGKPVAVRSGRANKFDGKISAFPGRGYGGSVDLEVVLSPETMAGVESDGEFMEYVSGYC